MKQYKVFYECERESASLINAGSMKEAAYLFFMNNPRKRTIFLESDGLIGGEFVSYKQLSDSFPDVPEILEELVAGAVGLGPPPDHQCRGGNGRRWKLWWTNWSDKL